MICRECGKEYELGFWGAGEKNCSRECQRLAYKKYRKQRYHAKVKHQKYTTKYHVKEMNS